MIKPILVGAGVGAALGYATGQDPLKSAVMGGATAGFSSAIGPSAETLAATEQFAQQGMVNPALTQTGVQQAASNQALSGGGGDLLGSFNPIQDAIDIDPSTFTASEGSLGNMMGGGGQAQLQNTGGFLEIPSINEGLLNTNTMSANTQTGPQQAATNDVGLLDNLGLGALEEYMPTKRDIGSQVIGMGVNALTPEQEERLRHQQAMLMRGQTGNVLGQGGTSGIGGQYISRA
jgi:hypothetical protein|tara:strand:+ start:102 stop:800 length:699 start_codon:yes stop_codon:yes gene_type:complete